MFAVLLGSALLAVVLTAMVVGVVRLAAMAARRMRGRTETLTAERCFAEASRPVISTGPSCKSGSCSNRR
jgi:hypothetical protein